MEQLQIPFEKVEQELNSIRENFCARAERFFRKDDVSLFARLVFDLSHKDFEYFLCYILKKEGYSNVHVAERSLDKLGIDVIAEKSGVQHFFQCKQWSSEYVDIKRLGEYYAKMYVVRKVYPKAKIHFVTTSYLSEGSQDFLSEHGISFWINSHLIQKAKAQNLQDEKNWKRLIQIIQYDRINLILGEYHQTRLYKDMSSIKHDLWQSRINECAMHTRNYKGCTNVTPPLEESSTFKNYFQYWNLI